MKHPSLFGVTLFFAMCVFLSVLLSSVLVFFLAYALIVAGIWDLSVGTRTILGDLILLQAVISLPIGGLVSLAVSRVLLHPMGHLVDGMNALAGGHYHTRLKSKGILWRYPAFSAAADSFNTLAGELENTEMLRSDFINNFSHEFKTPIVSIAGFAKLLRRGRLPEEQRMEYLQVIEDESMRLSYMATNVMNLTKVENQSILTDRTMFNLSEQLRASILLLESKWEKKDIEFRLDFGEHFIRANEELLKQVWINLLDNAIKFSHHGGTVEVTIRERADRYAVAVSNRGTPIPPHARTRIFNKFYQADESHAAEGNGVGLAIVKRVTELHGGRVYAEGEGDLTRFTVELPKT